MKAFAVGSTPTAPTKPIKLKVMDNVIMKFRSVAEFEAYLNGGTLNEAFAKYSKERSHEAETKKFFGTKDWNEADELLKYGDRKSYEMIKQ